MLYSSGCKHKGHWNCNKTYTGWNQSNSLSSNLVFSYSCSCLCHYTVKLFEQGESVIKLFEQGEFAIKLFEKVESTTISISSVSCISHWHPLTSLHVCSTSYYKHHMVEFYEFWGICCTWSFELNKLSKIHGFPYCINFFIVKGIYCPS